MIGVIFKVFYDLLKTVNPSKKYNEVIMAIMPALKSYSLRKLSTGLASAAFTL